MRKIILLLSILLLIIISKPVQAQEPFTTNYDLIYDVKSTGETTVEQKITITNSQKDVVATDYSLNIKKMKIFAVEAISNNNKLETQIEEKDGVSSINIIFKDPVLGEGSQNKFTIKYKTFDVAYKVGEVWNINIPKVNLLPNTNEYNVKLIIPKQLGPEIFISPQYNLKEETADTLIYNFTKENLSTSGITAGFGEFQLLNFKLDFEILNDSHFDTKKSITLPPDIPNLQQISYKNIEPAPNKIYLDDDSNLIAEYNLKPKEYKNISFIGTARIMGKQIKPEFGGNIEDIPNELISKYTTSNEFWHANTPEIVEIAKSKYDPNKTVSENAQEAYKYVTTALSYDFNALNKEFVTRKGSLEALSDIGFTSCMEFTDLFIAVVRSMGIPARELNGYAITNDVSGLNPLSINLKGGDLLHSWAEYYDPEFGWVPVDPTWGSTSGIDYFTKLDTNHLVFVIKGLDPNSPLPAGAYKVTGNNRQVYVDFSQDSNDNDFSIDLSIHPATDLNLVHHLNKTKKFHLKNNSQIVVYLITNKENITIPPGNYISIYTGKTNTLRVSDATNKIYEIEPRLETTRLENTKLILGSVVAIMLVLCTIVYYLIYRLQVLKKLIRRLNHRPQDQDL